MNKWMFLTLAIFSEVIATSTLKSTEGFSRLLPSIIVVMGYSSAFYFLSLTVNTIPVGISYAIWSGTGVALITMISWLFFRQQLDIAAIIGLALIISGVVVINLFSRTLHH